jgi:microcystin-dependent protein
MAEPFIGEIRLFAGNFAPAGWAFCRGQALPIVDHDALFQLIGTTYGGDGQETFALPDLRSRVPIHMGAVAGQPTYILGATGGTETVTLTTQQIPGHTHALLATSSAGTANSPAGRVTAAPPAIDLYIEDTPSASAAAQAIGAAGGSQPHENMQPYLCINYIIALFGLFPQFS